MFMLPLNLLRRVKLTANKPMAVYFGLGIQITIKLVGEKLIKERSIMTPH